MKALVLTRYGPPEDLAFREEPRPEPGPREVQVEVRAAGVNDWDWNLVRGKPAYMRALCGLRRPRVRIPGTELAGVVRAVGASVTRWRPGDRVLGDVSEAGFGAFAETVCVDQDVLTRIPEGLGDVEAAALPHAAGLAVQGLRELGTLRPGERVLVNGAGGGVGALAARLADHLGAGHVTGIDHGDKLAGLSDVGYDATHDYRTHDFTRADERYDLVLDVRTDRSPRAYARALRPGGRYVTVGGDAGKLMRLATYGRFVGRRAAKRLRVLALKPNVGLDLALQLVTDGTLAPTIDRVFPLDEGARAIRRFGESRHTGKVVITTKAADSDR